MIERKAEVVRKPIRAVDANESFQTIVSLNPNYTNAHVMNTYLSIEDARAGYSRDMDDWNKENGGETYHFGIRKRIDNEQ